MLILTVRTDKPEAEIGLYDSYQQLAYAKWPAHRELAETIHAKIKTILNKSSKSLKEVQGIVAFEGPGSFTGLRIGLSVANSLAYSLEIPIAAAGGKNWIADGTQRLLAGDDGKIALPRYGAPAKITQPAKKH